MFWVSPKVAAYKCFNPWGLEGYERFCVYNCAEGQLMAGRGVGNDYWSRTRRMSTKGKYCVFNTCCQRPALEGMERLQNLTKGMLAEQNVTPGQTDPLRFHNDSTQPWITTVIDWITQLSPNGLGSFTFTQNEGSLRLKWKIRRDDIIFSLKKIYIACKFFKG